MTEDIDPEKEIMKKFDALPQDIQSVIYSSDMSDTIRIIGEKHGLHVDQIGDLEDEAANVMAGFSEPNKFTESISKELGIERELAENISRDVNNELFEKIRESLRRVYEKKTDTTELGANRKQEILQLPQIENVLNKPSVSQEQLAPQTSGESTAPIQPYNLDPYHEPIE